VCARTPCSFPRIDQPAAPVVCRPTGPEARVQSASVYETERGTGVALQRSMKITAEEMLSRFLVERRNAIVRRYLPAVNPVVNLRLSASGSLTFENAAVEAGVASAPAEYVVNWSRFDNTSGVATPIADTSPRQRAPTSVSALPRRADQRTGGSRLTPTSGGTPPAWTLVGFERVPGGNPPGMRSASQRTN
jgi:hypothetical protein